MHVVTPEMDQFLALHKYQLESSCIPKIFWESLERKLRLQTFDAGHAFSLMKFDYEERGRGPREPVWAVVVTAEDGVSESDPESIYLVDHAWTFRVNGAKEQLQSCPQLLERLANMMDVSADEPEALVELVAEELWRYAQCYSLNASEAEERTPIWYIMDEVGSGVQHSDQPNVRIVPFVHLPDRITYSLMFPLEDLSNGTIVGRDFAEGPETDPDVRKALLLPWQPETSFLDEPFQQSEPPPSFFEDGRVAETLSDPDVEVDLDKIARPIRVYSEYSEVNKALSHPDFIIVNTPEEADLLWLTHHYKDFKSLGPNRFVNQFPYESVITVKDLLCVVCRRKADPGKECNSQTLEMQPAWLPTTYNLKTELPLFVSYFEHREDRGLDNHWICKPWNLARGLDTHISKNINFILRLPQSGPKIAQKYVEDPVLFTRVGIGPVKFDVRYVILLKSVQPLTAYVYKEFFVRFANLPFHLADLEQYERHFTVMNYENPEQLCHMKCAQFVIEFEQQYENMKWVDVEADILVALRGALEAAASKPPPQGIPHSPQSRAVYAADLMLSWSDEKEKIQPKLLEINWMPDCQRACQYYPSFYNDIFSTLFLGETRGKNVIPI
ncbi:tubulin--tyrosine ligase-like protein 12 [Cloeon dipterum]|uniref:tubulin--tyrosine ligase-like protein 12 n=1 Tax=Cloeon dipterum TaxID=197152 RepID=UPI0032203B34